MSSDEIHPTPTFVTAAGERLAPLSFQHGDGHIGGARLWEAVLVAAVRTGKSMEAALKMADAAVLALRARRDDAQEGF